MKKIFLLVLTANAFITLIILSGCKKDDDSVLVSDIDRITALLTTGSWTLQSVTIDGADQTSLFSGMVLTFTGNSFTANKGGVVWPSSGTWNFTDNNGQVMTRGDGLSVAVNEISESDLRLTLTWDKTTLGPGRIGSIEGVHVFVLGK